jgi:dTDP-4-dehydrorhamnose reductase
VNILELNILVIGKNGQVASAFCDISKKYPNYNFYFTSRNELDLSKPDIVFNKLNELDFSADIIINTAAYTAVDKAEEEKEAANNINNLAVAEIAKFCAKNNILLVHYSTDYIFDGSGNEGFLEDNTANLNPLNYYGKTKLDGENAIKNSGCNYLIIRTSWIYSHIGNNFVKTILKSMQEREVLQIVDDQIGSPTYAPDIAEATIKLIERLAPNNIKEIFNIVPAEQISWYEFALKIQKSALEKGYNLTTKEIKPIASKEYKTPAKRPKNSRLSNKKLNDLGIELPDIKTSLNKIFDLL